MSLQDKYIRDEEKGLLKIAEQDPNDALALSEKEEEVLNLHTQLQELDLQKAILLAHTSDTRKSPSTWPGAWLSMIDHRTSNGSTSIDQLITAAEKELLEIRGKYTVNKKIAENVLTTNPILRAVHGGEDLLPTERFASSLHLAYTF